VNGARPDTLEQQALERVQELIAALEALPDPATAAPARELVQLVLDLHGSGLARMLEIIADAGNGPVLLERLALDEQVKGLLLLHGLHPEDLEARVQQAVERLRPHLAVMGVSVQAALIVEGAVRLELHCGGNGHAPLPAEALRREIEDAIFDAAPDVAGIAIEGLPAPSSDESRPVVWSWSRDQPKAANQRA
jgi:hypothetical protein